VEGRNFVLLLLISSLSLLLLPIPLPLLRAAVGAIVVGVIEWLAIVEVRGVCSRNAIV
jgi:hypothetical protein